MIFKLRLHAFDDSAAAGSITLKVDNISSLDVVEVASSGEDPLGSDNVSIAPQPTESGAERGCLAANDLGELRRSEPTLIIVPPAGEQLKFGSD